MGLNGKKIGAFALAVGSLMVAGACTGSDPLTPGSGNIEITLDLDNIDGRFTDDTFDSALLVFSQIEVRPTDPAASTNTGALDLGLLRTPFRANFVSAIPSSELTALTSGEYRVQRIVVNQISFNDRNDLTVAGLSDPMNPVCTDFVKVFNTSNIADIEIFDTDLSEEVRRSLDANNVGLLAARVDYSAFLDALVASIDCASCNCPALYAPNVIPRSCSVSGATCSVDADCPSGQTCRDCTCPVDARFDFNQQTFTGLTSTYLTFD